MSAVPVVTIDGPAASGKSSVSRGLASAMGWDWVSTGAFYRGLAFAALAKSISLDDEQALVELSRSASWEVRLAPERTFVFLDGADVTDEIYKEDLGNAASQVGRHPKVRESLLQAQRNAAVGKAGLVAEGRDCGTVVFPDAPVKIYLTAHSESRAERRAAEQGRSLDETRAAQSSRDAQDSQRTAAPLQVAEGAHVIDTSKMDLQGVISRVTEIVRAQLA